MVGKRKRYNAKSRKGGSKSSNGGRGGTGSSRSGKSKSYRKSKRSTSKGSKVVRSKRSSASSFRKAVIHALAVTNTSVFEQSQRVTFNGGTKQSGFNYPVGTGAWAAEFDPPSMMSDVLAQTRQETAAPMGFASAVTGFAPGIPIDVYVTRSSVSMTITNCQAIPIYGRWYCLESRFDGQDYDPQQQYNNDISNMQGSVGTSLGQPLTADLVGTTPFNFRGLCEAYKIRPMSKVFKIEGGRPKRFHHSTKRTLHLTSRYIGINACKATKYFMFEFWGFPINDSVSKNFVNTSGGAVDIVCTSTMDYEYRPIPNNYKVFNSELGAVTTPSVMANNTLVVTTSIPQS